MKLQDKKPLAIAIIMMIAAQMGTNFYLVALPFVARHFNEPSSVVLDTLYYYLIPYGFFQLFIAPFVGRIGFRKTAFFGFIVFSFGIGVILSAQNIYIFALGRMVQGIGGSTIYVLMRMIIQRKYKETETNVAFSVLESFAMATPAIAPLLGARIIQFVPWQGLFYFILCYVVFAVFMANKMLDNYRTKPFPKIKSILLNYKSLVFNFSYSRFLFVTIFTFAPTVLCLSSLPFVLSHNFNLTPVQYSFCMSLTICGSFCGTLFSKLANESGFKNVAIKIAISIMIVTGIVLKSAEFLSFHSVMLFVLSSIVIFFSFGTIFPNAVADSFKQVSHKTGAEVALLGCFQVAGAGILNLTLSRFIQDPEVLLPFLFIISGLAIGFLYKFTNRK